MCMWSRYVIIVRRYYIKASLNEMRPRYSRRSLLQEYKNITLIS